MHHGNDFCFSYNRYYHCIVLGKECKNCWEQNKASRKWKETGNCSEGKKTMPAFYFFILYYFVVIYSLKYIKTYIMLIIKCGFFKLLVLCTGIWPYWLQITNTKKLKKIKKKHLRTIETRWSFTDCC